MPLLTTPRQLTERGDFYHQLATLTAAGVGLLSAVEMLRNAPPSGAYRRPLTHILESLSQGATFSDALAGTSRGFVSAFDLALIQAGEQSGRLDVCFRLLAEYYREQATLARRVMAELAYPLLVLHLAIVIFPPGLLARLVLEGDVAGFLRAKAAVLLPLYALVFLGLYLVQSRHRETWRLCLERILGRVPMLGTARADLALARLSLALESLLNAGVSMIEAWDLAAAASGSPALRRTVAAWRPMVLAGQTPAEAIQESGAFPELFANLYRTGEISGQLDDTLRRLARHYQEEASRKMQILAQWAPRLVYFLVVLLAAYQILSFYTGYFSRIGELAQ